jgi:hypothetical protein
MLPDPVPAAKKPRASKLRFELANHAPANAAVGHRDRDGATVTNLQVLTRKHSSKSQTRKPVKKQGGGGDKQAPVVASKQGGSG